MSLETNRCPSRRLRELQKLLPKASSLRWILRRLKTLSNPKPHPQMPAKSKSKKQVAYLLSKVSPLTSRQQSKLKKELHSGKVKVKKK